MTKKEIEKFVSLAEGPYIGYNPDLKAMFATLGKKVCRELVKLMGLKKGEYVIRYNPGGIAVCGDVVLHTKDVYILLTQAVLGPPPKFMWRLCDGAKDFEGGSNNWAPWAWLKDMPTFVGALNLRILAARKKET